MRAVGTGPVRYRHDPAIPALVAHPETPYCNGHRGASPRTVQDVVSSCVNCDESRTEDTPARTVRQDLLVGAGDAAPHRACVTYGHSRSVYG